MSTATATAPVKPAKLPLLRTDDPDEVFPALKKYALPKFAVAKLAKIETQHGDYLALNGGKEERLHGFVQTKAGIAEEVAHFDRQEHANKDDMSWRAELIARMAEIDRTIASIREEQKAISSPANPESIRESLLDTIKPRRIIEALDIEERPGATRQVGVTWPVVRDARVAVTLAKGKTPAAELKAAHDVVLALREQRKEVSRGKPALAERIEAATAAVDRSAARGAPDLSRLTTRTRTRLAGPVEIGTIRFPESHLSGLTPGVTAQRGIDYLNWLFRDQVVAKITAELKANYDSAGALSAEERMEKLAELDGRILTAERVREAWIEIVETDGTVVDRRWPCDFRAVLGISIEGVE